MWAGAIAAAGVVGYGAYRWRRRATKFELPEPPQGVGEPVPLNCELGPSYPGFVQDARGACVPTEATPPGIYVDVACSDFIYVPGDDGPQLEEIDKTIWALVAITKNPTSRAADPTHNVTQFLSKHWPACTWPPIGGTARMQQLFNVLSIMMGREIVHRGGRVLGTGSIDEVDAQVAERLAELGMPDFDPDVVPEIPLTKYDDPDEIDDEAQPPDDGPGVQEPDDPQGGIDLPPGGQDFPEPKPPIVFPAYVVPTKPCQTIPWSPPARHNIKVEDARFSGPSTEDILLFDFDVGDNSECAAYNVRFGLCLRPTETKLYGDFDPNSAAAGVHIRNPDGTPVDWSTFKTPALWKRQYKTRVGIADGKAVFDPPTPINDPGVDPCRDDDARWPTPSSGFFIVDVPPAGEFSPMNFNWYPTPKVQLVAKNRRVYVRLFYTGMPKMMLGVSDAKWGGLEVPEEWVGEYVAHRFLTTDFRADFKVWALGTLPA